MRSKILPNFKLGVEHIEDGSTIMIPGFAGPGTPRNLIAALIKQGAKNLIGISNHPGAGPYDDQLDLGDLIKNGQVKKMICCFTAAPHPSQATDFEIMNEKGQIEGEILPQGTLAERIRAAASGLGGFYTPAGVGTELAKGKEHRLIDGKEYLLEHPLHADYAFIRAYRADTFGNLQFRLSQRNFNPIMAMAAKTTIVEVETDIVPIGEIDPDQIHTPGIFIDHIIRIPDDGIWDHPIYRN